MKSAALARNVLAPTPAVVALVTLLALLWGGNSVFIKVWACAPCRRSP